MRAFFNTLAARLRGLFRRGDLETDFDQELAAHLEMAEEDGRRRGLSVEEARRAARTCSGPAPGRGCGYATKAASTA